MGEDEEGRREAMNKQRAGEVFDVLVREAGAREGWRESFVSYFADGDKQPKGFRFMGSLGFGGKCWLDPWHTPPVYVSCYREEETVARTQTIERTNAAIASLGWEP